MQDEEFKNNDARSYISKENDVTITDEDADFVRLKLPFLRHITIESKLKFGFGNLIVIIVITSALSIIGLQYVKDHYDYAVQFGLKLEQLSLEAQKDLLQARRREKDFLLRWKSYGVEKAKEKYIVKNKEAIDKVRKICKEIRELLPDDGTAGNRALRDSSDLLNSELDIYVKEFSEMVDLIEIQGFNNTGLEGTFREDAHKVGDSLEAAKSEHSKVLLLTLRRNEKDFLMRNDKKYVKKVSDTILLLKQDVDGNPISQEDKEEIKKHLDHYWITFDKLVDTRLQIAKKIEDFRFVAHEIETATEKFREIGKEEAKRYLDEAHVGAENTKAMVYSSVLVLFVIAFLLSWLLASHIKTPLSLLDRTVKRVREGQHETRAPVVTSDETGRLAVAFNEMNANLNKAIEDITKKSREIDEQRKLSESLLRNILPKAIANRLKEEETIAEWYGQVTVLFADMVGFTKLSSVLSATELVSRLNEVFSVFDEMTEKHGLEKIKTMGDCYMVAGGLPETCEDHAEKVAKFALELIPALEQINKMWTQKVQIRIGMNTGPVVAGVIGKSKFVYDLWGDAVNTASRMESHGVVGKVQVSESTYEILKDMFEFEERGVIQVKGKGEMKTYFMTKRKDLIT